MVRRIASWRPETDRRAPAVLFLALAITAAALLVLVRPLQQAWSQRRSNSSLFRSKPQLCFDATGHFKIVQLTDLHLGEDPFSEWAPRADRRTLVLIRQILEWERPDLVIFSGDMLTANNIDANATVYLDRLAAVLMMAKEPFGVPYAMTFGNHDDMDLEIKNPNGNIHKIPAKTSRRQLVRSDQQYAHSLTQAGPEDVFGVSNYILSVFGKDHDNNNLIQLQIMMLDSGGGSLEQQLDASQMQWYQSQRQPLVDAVAFQHIPTREFNFPRNSNNGCRGGLHDEGVQVAALHQDPWHELDWLQQHDPRLHFLAVGHNHGNSYCCPAIDTNTTVNDTTDNTTDKTPAMDNHSSRSSSSHLHVCFGRHSGYGGYGEKYWLKGARVYDIWLDQGNDNQRNNSIQWKTWVRLETGYTVDHFSPGQASDRTKVQL